MIQIFSFSRCHKCSFYPFEINSLFNYFTYILHVSHAFQIHDSIIPFVYYRTLIFTEIDY